ncbi:MAG TPA: M3 family metallopeptidase [Candidatus Cloacimonadota bacterium]|nr:M3 family metallopeptidase [Candidatus Cloacimonadota bacterium]HQL15390.1 M3 family metallopeptidase [Candidatus Cloacimonadota bacterium]
MDNPLLDKSYKHRLDAIPFHLIKTEHFLPAVEETLKQAKANFEQIRNNSKPPDFENTILAMEFADEDLDYVASVYFHLLSAESDAEFKALAQEISPLLAEFSSSIMTDEKIFARVQAVYEQECMNKPAPKPDFKNKAQMLLCERYRLSERVYKSFKRNGALLNPEQKARLTEIDKELSKLSPKFADNVLAATNAFELHLTNPEDIEGIPESALQAAAYLARQKGKTEGWLFNLQMPSYIPVLTYCKKRKIRETMQKAYASRAFKDEFDNQANIRRILELRYERSQLLGYKTHAHYVLEERMALTPEAAQDFLEKIYAAAYPAAQTEVEEVKAFAKTKDGLEELMPWDWAYYSNQLKEQKFQFDPEQLRPWFKLENVVEGLFTLANKIYGVTLKQVDDVPVYHKDVTTWEVYGEDKGYLGLLYLDLFPRETKRGGAWMNDLKGQGLYKDGMKRPHVVNVASLTPSTPEQPSLLLLDEVRTIFHEFGHALHALLSDCTYKSLAGPNVLWDFVELPSQIMENWLLEKEALNLFAKHYQTGEPLPDELLDKVLAARNFQAGYANLGQLRYAFLDFAWHLTDPNEIGDINDFENKVIQRFTLLPLTPNSNISCSFSHVFAGGYAAGYYSYKWAEALEADAWSLIKEKGIFNHEATYAFRDIILSQGNAVHPMDLFVSFRGRQPDPDALLKRDGLL